MSFAGASCSCNTVLSVRIYRNPQTAKLEIGPACQRHIGVIFADMEIDYDKLAAAILRQQQQQLPVVRDAAILNPSMLFKSVETVS